MMELPLTKVNCPSEIYEGIIEASLLTNVLERVLYTILHREIGQRSLMLPGSLHITPYQTISTNPFLLILSLSIFQINKNLKIKN